MARPTRASDGPTLEVTTRVTRRAERRPGRCVWKHPFVECKATLCVPETSRQRKKSCLSELIDGIPEAPNT
jgi:hypothetical protein